MSIKKLILSIAEEFVRSRVNANPLGFIHYRCSECGKMELSRSRPSKKGCPDSPDGKHKWNIMPVTYHV